MMKKFALIVALLVYANQAFAQQELIDVGYWKLHYMDVDGVIHNVPQSYPVGSYDPGITFSEPSSQFYEVTAKVIDNLFMDTNPPTIIDSNSFTIQQPDVTLGFCEDLCELEDLYLLDILLGDASPNRVFNYEIIEESGGNKLLIITSPEGNIAVHGNYSLSTKDFSDINFSISPNPSNGSLNIDSLEPIERVRIYSVNGKLVKETFAASIDVSEFKSGMYFVTVWSSGKTQTKKFIKI